MRCYLSIFTCVWMCNYIVWSHYVCAIALYLVYLLLPVPTKLKRNQHRTVLNPTHHHRQNLFINKEVISELNRLHPPFLKSSKNQCWSGFSCILVDLNQPLRFIVALKGTLRKHLHLKPAIKI